MSKRNGGPHPKSIADIGGGAASAKVEFVNGKLTVRHGETGELLIERQVSQTWWLDVLWPTLKGWTP
jgi:hypothetical protein